MLIELTPAKGNGVSSVVIIDRDELERHRESKDVKSYNMCLEAPESKIHEEKIPEGYEDDKTT